MRRMTASEQSIWDKTFSHGDNTKSIPLKITIALGLISGSMLNTSPQDDNSVIAQRKEITGYHFEYDDILEKGEAAMGNRAFNDELVSRHELEKTELLFDQKTKNLDDKINHLNSDMNARFDDVNKRFDQMDRKLDAIIAEMRELPTKDYVDKKIAHSTTQYLLWIGAGMVAVTGILGTLIALY